MKRIHFISYSLFSLLIMGCNIQNRTTTLEIVDNNRHYHPVRRGQKIDIVFPVKNTGETPFIMSDIFTSCSCLEVSKKSSIKSIPAGKRGFIWLKYDSKFNIGYAEQYITLYGNLEGGEKKEIKFDLNIVPDADYTKDYEELYQKEKNQKANIQDLVDGKKRYYLDL